MFSIMSFAWNSNLGVNDDNDYCRNVRDTKEDEDEPDNYRRTIWCYTGVNKEWEFCDPIPEV